MRIIKIHDHEYWEEVAVFVIRENETAEEIFDKWIDRQMKRRRLKNRQRFSDKYNYQEEDIAYWVD